MTTIRATTIEDSISPEGYRLFTTETEYPLPIHNELMTHRAFSKNAASARAVPIKRLIERVMTDPYVPLHWGAAQKGMQASQQCDNAVWVPMPVIKIKKVYSAIEDLPPTEVAYIDYVPTELTREAAWLHLRDQAVKTVEAYDAAGYHKQNPNRLLGPWAHIITLVSGTQREGEPGGWSNFFALRDHAAAEPHLQLLAKAIRHEYVTSHPRQLQPGQWHLPYLTARDRHDIDGWAYSWEPDASKRDRVVLAKQRQVSIAKCASTSYKTVEGDTMTIERADKVFTSLLVVPPIHASPAEHVATPDAYETWTTDAGYRNNRHGWQHPEQHGNFVGWIQYRKTLKGECG